MYPPNQLRTVVKTIHLLLALFCCQLLSAQIKINLNSLQDFDNAGANWHIAGDVQADINKSHSLHFTPGVGVLVNLPDSSARKDLFTNFKHGDVDIELDCLMAKESNSGIYLQGRYELQLLDSWGVLNPRSSDMGGIYERIDGKRPVGQTVFDGRAPRQNASKAPGLWQHFKISFQAPRFVNGIKTKNAKIVRVELNGVLIQENIELSGPTAGAISKKEVAEDALRIQGDHGQVAFRNIVITDFNHPKPTLSGLSFSAYKGKFENEPTLATLKPFLQKSAPLLTVNLEGIPKNNYLLRYTGTLTIHETGEYNFDLNAKGGPVSISINHSFLYPYERKNGNATIHLQKGELPFELIFSKYFASETPSLILRMNGLGIRDFVISDPSSVANSPQGDPVLIDAKENIVLRSFIDLPVGKRVVHAVNVGSPEKIHYTFDMDNGMVVQAWRGDFLDATPMWIGRGDGSSKPLGAVQYFGAPSFALNQLANTNTAWNSDTAGTGFQPKGYVLDETNRPSFTYKMYGSTVTDITRVLENRQGIQRAIQLKNSVANLYVHLATATKIEELSTGFYLIDDHAYYIKIDDAGNAKPLIREQKGQKELLVPIQSSLTYSILF